MDLKKGKEDMVQVPVNNKVRMLVIKLLHYHL